MHRLANATLIACCLLVGLPTAASAHLITEQYRAPLPLVAYIVGAALAVAMSFAFVMLRVRRPPPAGVASPVEPVVHEVPRWLRTGLGAIGLLGWAWVVVQGLFGGQDATADAGAILVWVYGWIGIAVLSALVGPAWSWLDPFSTLHRLLATAGTRLGLTGGEPEYRPYPQRWGTWPAVIGFLVVVWLELVALVTAGRMLGLAVLAYTFFTLAGMSWFGRATWRARGEVFSVWFGLLGRLAPLALVGEPEHGRVQRRPFASGLAERDWSTAAIVLLSVATGAIIYDGLSQTGLYVNLFGSVDLVGLPPTVLHTLIMLAFLGLLVALVLWVARLVGRQAIGAGLLPVAVGYLLAHYSVALLIEGQLIVRALNDPLARGDSLLGPQWALYEAQLFVPISLVWSFQLAAVVGGHVLGAWAGHSALERRSDLGAWREVTLAGLMVVLTSVTLWSLGQEVIVEDETAGLPQTATIEPGLDQRAVSSAASTVLMMASLRTASSRNSATPAETDTLKGVPRSSGTASSRT
jgi:hypothetical protein